MRGVSYSHGRAEDAEADEENRIQYHHYFDNTYLYDRIFIVRCEVFNNIYILLSGACGVAVYLLGKIRKGEKQ